MGAFGADVGQLRALGREFRRGADVLDADVLASLSRSVGVSGWRGPDANAFRGAWSGELSAQLRGVRDALRTAAGDVDRHAREQEQASQAKGGVNGSVTGGRSSSSGDFGRATVATKASYKKPDEIVRRQIDLGKLAKNSYAESGSAEASQGLPDGWSRVSDDEMRKLGINPNILSGKEGFPESGFKAALYKNKDGEYVLAFAGTDDFADALTDLKGTVVTTEQDTMAMLSAKMVRDRLAARGVPTENITLTGHSLGGRLSDVARTATGLKSTTFNSCGISASAYNDAKNFAARNGEYRSDAELRAGSTAIVHKRDPLSNGQGNTFFHDPLGRQKAVGEAYNRWNPLDYFDAIGNVRKNHSVDAIITELEKELPPKQ